MKHEQLKNGDIVIFKIHSDEMEEDIFQDGNVLDVYADRKEISIIYLEGYKSRNDNIPYDKVIAKFDLNGKYMTFGNLSGTSVLIDG